MTGGSLWWGRDTLETDNVKGNGQVATFGVNMGRVEKGGNEYVFCFDQKRKEIIFLCRDKTREEIYFANKGWENSLHA